YQDDIAESTVWLSDVALSSCLSYTFDAARSESSAVVDLTGTETLTVTLSVSTSAGLVTVNGWRATDTGRRPAPGVAVYEVTIPVTTYGERLDIKVFSAEGDLAQA